jgi:surfeit locus 1 family protein
VTPTPERWRAIVVALATLAGVAVTLRAGIWQLDRAQQKEALQRALDERAGLPELDAAELALDANAAAAQQFRHVRLRGRWLASATVFLENRPLDGRVGFIALTPLLPERGGAAVLVQRGWAARDSQDRTRVPELAAPAGPVEVVGIVAPPPARWFEFAGAAAGPIRQNVDLADLARESGIALRPLSVLQLDSASNSGDGLVRHWARPAVDVHKHYGYAAQWFALAALMATLYVWFRLIRPRLRR